MEAARCVRGGDHRDVRRRAPRPPAHHRDSSQRARDLRLRCVVFTFDRHPLETLKPGKHPPYLSSIAQKLRLLEELDVDLVLMSRFDEKFATISADSFFDNTLRRKLGAEVVVVGENFP